jgi:GDP-L-fucose synthase
MNRNSRIYIAGHTGLVGSAIVRRLREKGYSNLLYKHIDELDLRNQEMALRLFDQEKPEYVFLAAAKVGGILANNKYRAEFIYDNIMISSNIINASYRQSVKKLLNLGSSCIYPKLAPQPMKEEYLLTGLLEPTNEPYAIAKIAAIKLCGGYNEQYGTNYLSVMPTNLYGPGDNFNLETAHLLPALLRKFYLAKLLRESHLDAIKRDLRQTPLGLEYEAVDITEQEDAIREVLRQVGITDDHVTVWGSGKPYREFLHVDDLADACVFVMERYDHKEIGEFINIGTGDEIQVLVLSNMIREVIGCEAEIYYDLSKPDGTPRKLLDCTRINDLGWRPRISLRDGIKSTYEWYVRRVQ